MNVPPAGGGGCGDGVLAHLCRKRTNEEQWRTMENNGERQVYGPIGNFEYNVARGEQACLFAPVSIKSQFSVKNVNIYFTFIFNSSSLCKVHIV